MSFGEYLAQRWQDIVVLGIQHAQVVLIAVGIATVVGVATGILVERHPLARRAALTVTGTMLTIPSFALFGLLIPILNLGAPPAIAALVLYALFPILRNAITGLESVPAEIEDAARGMGLSSRSLLLTVRVPLAWPVVLNGIRIATIMSVGIAAIGAAVAGPGLGRLIFDGLARIGGANALNDTLAGLLGVAVLALILDLGFVLISRFTTPRGIRG
ncbi:ABC transporter permease [Phytoactinopolyspora mesophila]|uniref:ABC transporter permease subunit n=1 Tax=Phytoactinopolyspora mesophila TaxID=2650750 RepID=A0A7K3M3P8_9ACTN|nr:ABC transporter permease [Phytoactinopolyspora mesophila]NDL57944.1 ABC transporter permease subunit [Phytoactinopolyspora mesophila]